MEKQPPDIGENPDPARRGSAHVVALTDSDREFRRLQELFNLLNDGIIVMDKDRIITFVNPAATRLTGWELGDVIPYCSFCQARSVAPGEERCFLASQPDKSYFESEMPTKHGAAIGVGMSRTFLSQADGYNNRDMVITIRDVSEEWREHELELRRKLNQHTLEVQEQERKRLSQELHDGISQTLYGISLKLEHLMNRDPRLRREVRELHRQIRSCGEEVRNMSHSLYPAVLYDIGLVAAVRSLAAQLTTPARRITVHVELDWVPDGNDPHAVHVYRIIQEAVHNAISHGDAHLIELDLWCRDQDCGVTIRDDGCGFDTASVAHAEGYGLRNMRERARALSGALTIASEPGAATEIAVRFPNPSKSATPEIPA